MYLWEGARLAFDQLRSQKLKSFFTLLGVIIGVMFLIVVVSVVEGMDRYIREDFAKRVYGINTLTLQRRPSVQINPDAATRRAWARRPRISYEDAKAIEEQIEAPAVIAVASSAGGELEAETGRKVENVRVTGASENYFRIRQLEVTDGRLFSPQEARRGVPVVVLGSGSAQKLFGDLDPVGRFVRIRGFRYRVIGVLEKQGSLLGISLDTWAIAPAQSPVETFTNPAGIVDEILIQSVEPQSLARARYEVEAIMRVRHRLRPGEPNDFEIETSDDSLSFWERISRILFIALPGLVAISLVVGGIVIMNIMLVSVLERTREIGIRKAIGARRRDILIQVLIESATLSGAGAAVGVGIGIALAQIVRAASPLPAAVAPKWVAVGVLLGLSVGIAAGVYPAARAAKLDPVEALRHE
ncbi:MAG: ABC transporter permease [Gemmatimonadetes bacterium]|nr:ABC transporter permease [Gemmatimonadota bacterium]